MILKKMTATFGRLERDTLELHEGLNVVSRPNESGKSTWAAFLLAMFYGIDTTERASRGNIPAKTRFKPWSGHDMEGSVELESQGRGLTIERGPQGRVPMSALRVYETESGVDVDFPEGCGPALLGVERSVYRRSGFIGQQAIALSADDALEARLRALVTTGDENVNGSRALQMLRDLRNRRRHNRTGLLPKAEAKLSLVETELEDLRALGHETMELQARRIELEKERDALSRRLAAQRARESAERRETLRQAREDWERKEKNLWEKEQTVHGLPEPDELEELLREIERLTAAAQALKRDEDRLEEVSAPPVCPPVFEGLTPAEVRAKAEADARRFAALRPAAKGSLFLMCFLALAALLGGIVCVLTARVVPSIVCFALAAVLGLLTVLRCRKDLRVARRRREILERYGASDETGIRKAAADYREAMLLHVQQANACERRRAELESLRQTLADRRDGLAARLSQVCPGAKTLNEARDGVQRALNLQKFYQAAMRETQPAKARFEALRDASPEEEAPSMDYDPDEAQGDPRDTLAKIARLDEELRRVCSRLDNARGRMDAGGDPAALAAEKEELTARIERMTREYDALELAISALNAASEEIQTRFSPRINELAGEYMARMTGGRYDRVMLSQSMAVTAREAGNPVSRPLAALSAGTGDQLYLAIRLAISRLLLPEDAPILLDDALASLDDERMAAAMELLLELSENRQIILFTCHSRELEWLKNKEALS